MERTTFHHFSMEGTEDDEEPHLKAMDTNSCDQSSLHEYAEA